MSAATQNATEASELKCLLDTLKELDESLKSGAPKQDYPDVSIAPLSNTLFNPEGTLEPIPVDPDATFDLYETGGEGEKTPEDEERTQALAGIKKALAGEVQRVMKADPDDPFAILGFTKSKNVRPDQSMAVLSDYEGRVQYLKKILEVTRFTETEDAIKRIDRAGEMIKASDGKTDAMDEDSTDSLPQADETTRGFYAEATPFIERLIVNINDEQAENSINDINEKIATHNKENQMDEKTAERLEINLPEFTRLLVTAQEALESFLGNDLNNSLRKQLKDAVEKQSEFNKRFGYPDSWVVHIPAKPQARASRSQAAKANQAFAAVAGHASHISVNIKPRVKPGSTSYGGTILRYWEHFKRKDDPENERKKAKYTFFVREDGPLGPEFRLKTGKEIGDTAMEAYLQSPDKMKIGQYYGEEKFGVKYTKQFFKDYCLHYFGGCRRSSQTKSGRTMPQETCVVGFEYNENAWYDVITRSKFRSFAGGDADARCDQWWTDHGEGPSTRKALVEGESPSKVGWSSTGARPSDARVNTLAAEVASLRLEVKESSVKRASGASDSLANEVADLRREVGKFQSVENTINTLGRAVEGITLQLAEFSQAAQQMQQQMQQMQQQMAAVAQMQQQMAPTAQPAQPPVATA